MLCDFLSSCKCVFSDEKADFQRVINEAAGEATIGFMPAIIADFYPIFALSCTSAKQMVLPNYYILSVGVSDWAKAEFEKIIDDFYQDREYQDQYNVQFEEMILLNCADLKSSFTFTDGKKYNVAYCCILLADGSLKHLLIIPENPDDCWKMIFESYRIKCDILIDSHKGMGNWLESIPLYKSLRTTTLAELLPRYYFKGLYISHEAPAGFHLTYTIPEAIYKTGSAIEDWQKQIYEIDWDENRLATKE